MSEWRRGFAMAGRTGARRGRGVAALSVAALAALALAGGARAQTESACKGKLKKACRQDDACVHAGKGLCLDAIDPCNGIQAKKNGQTRKAQCEAKTGIDDRKCKCTKPNKKKCGVCETTGISGDGKAFLKDNLMVISGGGLTYKPHKKDGDWTPLCSVTGQAVEMSKVDLGKDGGPAAAKQIWDSNAAFNKPNLPGKYFEHTRKDNKGELYFMDKFFQTAVIGAGPGGCGTDDDSAREQITKKTTQDWVAVTHIMAALDLAEDELVKHPEKPHKAHPYYDRVAALYFGCGDTNPIPLREGVTWGDMAPKDASKNTDPFGPSKYAVSGRADMRAKNYGTLVVVPTPAGVQRETAAVNVQVLNALKMEPSLLGIAEIRDAIYTIYSQATLRYTSKMSLDAKLPGNGLGGSVGQGACGGSNDANGCCKAGTAGCTALAQGKGLVTVPGQTSIGCYSGASSGLSKDSAPKNPSEKSLLEGLAFFKPISGPMANGDTVLNNGGLDAAAKARNAKCAETINAMLSWNDAGDGAVVFPTWNVYAGTLGETQGPYTVPSGFCYAQACLDLFMTSSAPQGGLVHGELVASPQMGNGKSNSGCGHAYGACVATPSGWNGAPLTS